MSIPADALSPLVIKHVDPQSPQQVRLMTAKGLVTAE